MFEVVFLEKLNCQIEKEFRVLLEVDPILIFVGRFLTGDVEH